MCAANKLNLIETRRQPEQNSATQVTVRCGWSTSGVDDRGDAQSQVNPGRKQLGLNYSGQRGRAKRELSTWVNLRYPEEESSDAI